MDKDPDTFGPEEARRALGISSATYYRWLREGKLRGVRAGRRWRFPRAAIEALLREPVRETEAVQQARQEALAGTRERLRARGVRSGEVTAMETKERTAGGGDARVLARFLLEHAHRARATAVHVEAGAGEYAVRERIDGALVPVEKPLPPAVGAEVVAELKEWAGLDPLPARRPAAGRFFAELGGRRIDVDASTFPTGLGENVTLRLLDPAWTAPRLEAIGFSPSLCTELRARIRRPRGLLVVNGPTDSGKTTTLYSLLVELRSPDLKIMTAEDPVEVRLEGLQQADVGGEGGMGFAAAVGAMLRSEVDVAMVSEIRTDDMFGRVLSVASAGRRIFTALHAPDAVSALYRMITMGKLNGSWVADNLLGILDQRLVRLNCPDCRRKTRLGAEEARALGLADAGRRDACSSAGCARCRQTGSRGRTAVGALLTVTPALRGALEAGADSDALRAAATDQPGLREALSVRVNAGDIAPAEALRHLPGAEAKTRG